MILNNPQIKKEFNLDKYTGLNQPIQVQFSKSVSSDFLEWIDEALLKHNDAVIIRFYSYDGLWADLSFISNLRHIKSLVIDEPYLQSIDFISRLKSLDKFILGATKRPIDLAVLRESKIKSLGVEGIHRGLVGYLNHVKLKELSLWNCSIPSGLLEIQTELEYLCLNKVDIPELWEIGNLFKLKELRLIQLKSIFSVEFISKLKGLERIELRRLSNCSDLPVLSDFADLEELVLESLPKVKLLEFKDNVKPKIVYILNCKGIDKNNTKNLKQMHPDTKFVIEN